MEQEKSKKGVIVVLIVIIVLLLLALGYVLFENKLLDDNKVDNSTTTTTTTTSVIMSGIDGIKAIFSQKNDSIVINLTPQISDDILKTNFKELDKSIGNDKIIASCVDYLKQEDEPEYYGCQETKVDVNDTFSYRNYGQGCSSSGKLYKYDNHLIHIQIVDGCIGSGKITIYDNNVVVFNNDKMYETIFDKDETSIIVSPIILDGKLYFMESTDSDKEMNILSVDLKNDKLVSKLEYSVEASHGSER